MKQWLVFLFTLLSACTSINVREDVFISEPIWEATQGPFATLRPDPGLDEVQTLANAPALAGLVEQVLKEQVSPSQGAVGAGGQRCDIGNADFSDPLPAELVDDPVTHATVLAMKESYLSATDRGRTGKLADVRLTYRDFRNMVARLNQSALAPYRTARYEGIEALNAGKLTWQGLFHRYLVAYFNNGYVDRRGAEAAKPAIDLTVTNDTITALVTIYLDSLWDWAILDCKMRNPILYIENEEGPEFLIGQPPTLWPVLNHLGMQLPIPFVIERVVESDELGISRPEDCIVKTLSGLAGDAAQGSSGIIVRALGGFDLGFVVLGKFSFGDNDTLTKIVDTWTESTGRRATEAFLAHLLYQNRLPSDLESLCPGE